MTDDELRKVAFEFREEMLGGKKSDGMCFIVSTALGSFLDICCGVQCVLAVSDHEHLNDSGWVKHYWIRLKDGRALDATFDQFGGNDPIYLGEPTRFHESAENLRKPMPSIAGV
jgi:hypothetical protein